MSVFDEKETDNTASYSIAQIKRNKNKITCEELSRFLKRF